MVTREKFKKLEQTLEDRKELAEDTINIDLKSAKQASKDSVTIMLIRAYRIRGHLIANLDPLSIQKRRAP